MDRILKLVDWFLFTSLFTAFCALGLCMSTERLISGDIPTLFTSLHALVFGATLAVYNTHILVRKSTPEQSDLCAWSLNNKYWLYIFLVLGAVMGVTSMFFLPMSIIVASGIMGAFAFAYSVPILPFKNLKRVRDIGIVKIIVLAGVWTTATTILPILYQNKAIVNYPFEVIIRLVFISILCIAFDLRDMQTDARAHVNTVPILIGVKRSYRIMDAGIIVFICLGVTQYLRLFRIEQVVGIFITALVTKKVLDYVRYHPSDRAYMGLVDGLMIVYAALALLH